MTGGALRFQVQQIWQAQLGDCQRDKELSQPGAA